MSEQVAWVVGIASVAVAVFAAWHVVWDRPFGNPLFWAVGALEVLLVVVTVGACIAVATTERDVDGVLFISYLLTALVIPPAAVLWGIAEKTRWGTGVVTVALLTAAVLVVRVHQIWVTPGA